MFNQEHDSYNAAFRLLTDLYWGKNYLGFVVTKADKAGAKNDASG